MEDNDSWFVLRFKLAWKEAPAPTPTPVFDWSDRGYEYVLNGCAGCNGETLSRERVMTTIVGEPTWILKNPI